MKDTVHSAYMLGLKLSDLLEVSRVMHEYAHAGFYIIVIYNPATHELTWDSITDVEIGIPAFRIFRPQPGTVYFASDRRMTCEAIADKLLELVLSREG